MNETMVVLVDERDRDIGTMPKLEAHRRAMLHRAFSVFIFNSRGELLLQQRAGDKYHSGGLWTNTCCSHPGPGESVQQAAAMRLMEEMGLAAELEYLFKFRYHSPYENKLSEHEIDHVFVGYSDETPRINRAEVSDYRYMSPAAIREDMNRHPERYTTWFRIIFGQYADRLFHTIRPGR